MKRQIKTVLIIVIIAVLALGIRFIFQSANSEDNLYISDYYEVNQPANWVFEPVSENDTIVNVKINHKKTGYIEAFPNCEYADSVNSIITNIYGMHAYLKEDLAAASQNPDLLYCVVIGYEPSAAQEAKNELPEDELHYLYLSEKNTLIDFCVGYPLEDDSIREVMESVKVINKR